ncbi:hypothetical protein ANN_09191 [Periplaneta americana]|uniref:DUF4817 domain-containing protein n=1 Tax=Periplaneta americana TaxID=6978 RepID=A0ABQ8TKT2_PERAM|nr:hypothetical protein ANN_09191 [Periplaneta americana]
MSGLCEGGNELASSVKAICKQVRDDIMANWTVAERVFAVTAYIEYKSITHVQRRFRNEFNVLRHGRISSRNIILKWLSVNEQYRVLYKSGFQVLSSVCLRRIPVSPTRFCSPLCKG